MCFERVVEEWPGVFWHEEAQSMLIVYADDFKFVAKIGEHDALWAAIRRVIDMDPNPSTVCFLGRSHERITTTANRVHYLLDNHPLYHP